MHPPTPTETFPNLAALEIPHAAVCIFDDTGEERSRGFPSLLEYRPDASAWRILDQRRHEFSIRCENVLSEIALRSTRQLRELLSPVARRPLIIDITGLAHHVWAPLVKAALSLALDLRVLYVEPKAYSFKIDPQDGQLFDLSERIEGIGALPGFSFLIAPTEGALFVPLLGFEGARLALITETAQPSPARTWPVVGVPGFRVEYPFHTYVGNRRVLSETGAWRNIVRATANCPFSLYYALARLKKRPSVDRMRIALIGTKPHSLGAVLFAIQNPRSVELLYDYPVRKPTRTSSTDRILLYDVSKFLADHIPRMLNEDEPMLVESRP